MPVLKSPNSTPRGAGGKDGGPGSVGGIDVGACDMCVVDVGVL
jgi:hypothetical protein